MSLKSHAIFCVVDILQVNVHAATLDTLVICVSPSFVVDR